MDISDVCASNMKCCVSKQMFNEGNTPAELVIPNRNKNQNQNRPEVTTTSSPRSEPTAAPEKTKNTAPPGSCQGTCVTGFFALLCDEIDRKADCPGNGRCCLTKKVGGGNRPNSPPPITAKCPGFCLPQSMSSLCTKPSNILHNTKSCNKGTVCCESRDPGSSPNAVERTPPPTIRTTTKRPAPPPPPRPQRPAGGGGPDLTSLLLSAAPTILSAATGNSDAGTTAAALLPVLGTVLGAGLGGGGGGGAAPPSARPQAPPAPAADAGAGGLVASLLPTLVGTFLGGGGQQPQRPPPNQNRPFRPPVPTPATTQPTTTTEPADLRPDCPGTCIASYLSFTCFGKFSNHTDNH